MHRRIWPLCLFAFFTFFLSVLISSPAYSQALRTRFEESGGTQTPPYAEIIQWWQKLDATSGKVKLLTMGMTDAGFPLHLAVLSNRGDYNFEQIRKNNKRVILINNGIHPGEPDGIDASMLLARDIVAGKYRIPDHVVLAFIPVYNIGGCLNRSAQYRVDQNGPEEFGFRGNSQNLDLNRDAIKCDSREARAFTEIFHLTDPDVFVDNHVSNGADYQHVMTLLTTQHTKLGGVMGEYLAKEFEPALYRSMKTKGYDLIPYVNVWGDSPDKGWSDYWDSPRYASGFAALWHSFSFVPETHMLKPYNDRVLSTYALMQCFIEFTAANSEKIRQLRKEQKEAAARAEKFPIRWSLDKTVFKEVLFRGYAAAYKPSGVSGQPRLYYDRSRPYDKLVPIYDHFPPVEWVEKPAAYIIPQGWWKVTDLLRLNKVVMKPLSQDTVIEVEVYRITDYRTQPRQYEMHHLNYDVKTSLQKEKIAFRKGDWYIPLNQPANRFLVETLEPRGEDSYFAWNYFDAILGQKEGYSAYAFEDIAADYLAKTPALQQQLNERRAADTAFAKDGRAQLNFVYQQSPWFEPVHMRYPVYRVR
ncbi:MAG: M14 family metallopeptidase [Chitinophagaceae bacterium]|nr:M14 family metallopeptidase [Chitinophagaceae bacterium]